MIKLAGILLLMLLSYASTHWIDLSIFALDKAFVGAAFILLGGMSKSLFKYIEIKQFDRKDVLFIITGLIIVVVTASINTQQVRMFANEYGNYGCFILGAVAGILSMIFIGKYLYALLSIKKAFLYKIVMWDGYNSLVLFIVHINVFQIFHPLFLELGVKSILGPYMYWTALIVTMQFVSIPICNIIIHYIPWSLGLKNE